MNSRITVKRARSRGVGAADLGLALFGAAALGFAGYAMPDPLFGSMVGATGIAAWIPAAEPPLGATARIATVAAASIAAFAGILALMRALNRPRWRSRYPRADQDEAAIAPRSDEPDGELPPPPFYMPAGADARPLLAEKPAKRMALEETVAEEGEADFLPGEPLPAFLVPEEESEAEVAPLDLAALAERPLSDFADLAAPSADIEPAAVPESAELPGAWPIDRIVPAEPQASPGEVPVADPETVAEGIPPVAQEIAEAAEPVGHEPEPAGSWPVSDAFDLGPFREMDEAILPARDAPAEDSGATISDLMRRLEAGIGRRAATPPPLRADNAEEAPGTDRLRSAIDDLQKLIAQKG